MGCDMHSIIQVKKYSYWYNRIITNEDRFYLFYGSLAGLRNHDITPIFPPRGIPKDFNDNNFLSREHSASWFTLAEAKRYVFNYLDNLPPKECLAMNIGGDFFGSLCNRWNSLIEDMEYCKKWADLNTTDPNIDNDIRIVFDFDS